MVREQVLGRQCRAVWFVKNAARHYRFYLLLQPFIPLSI
jgi:hypothetical protein